MWKSKLKSENEQCLEVTETTFLKEIFFLNCSHSTVTVRKWKKNHPFNFYIYSPLLFWLHLQIFLKLLPHPFRCYFYPPKKGGYETIHIHLKLCTKILDSFYVFRLEHFYIFLKFYCCWLCSIWFLQKVSILELPTFIWRNKKKYR